MMKLFEIIAEVNDPEIKMDEVAKKLNVSRDVLRDRLKSVGFKYDSSTKTYVFDGENIDEVYELSFEDLSKNKSYKNQRKITKKSEEKNEKTISLDENEIKFVKSLYQKNCKSASEFTLSYDFHRLPLKEKGKKHQMEISEKTLEKFEEFASRMKAKRYSKNDLIEIALVRLMDDFYDL